MPLVVGRPRSLKAVAAARANDGLIIVITQRVIGTGDPSPDDLYRVGTLCKIDSTIETEAGGLQLVITGIARYRVLEFTMNGYLSARGETVADAYGSDKVRTRALFNSLKHTARDILDMLPGAGEPLARLVDKLEDPTYLSNLCAAYINLPTPQKQELLEDVVVESRMSRLLEAMQKEKDVLNLQKDIQDKMAERLNKAQRDALLREQMRTIREELGEEGVEINNEISHRLDLAKLPDEVRKVADDELKRLEDLPPASAEYHVIRTYLEWLAEMPWNKTTTDSLDIKRARKILDEDHYGLEHVKKRILQHLAVAKLKNDLHGPIMCLIGPPGVGKTSLGQSIARALGRKFIRTSLGGVRDEAEIRGHRRTYIGAMPGRIVQSLRRIGVNNPLFMLDEIDKLGMSFQGDPASAMLEVLDPEQNKSFVDHYLDVAFDLSNVFFVATANVVDTIPPPLRDRMEMIEVTGYTTIEKLQIAKKYLVPKQLKEHGLKSEQVNLNDEVLLRVINHYTREAGVRELQRVIATLCRVAAEEIVGREDPQAVNGLVEFSPTRLTAALGPERFHPETSERSMRPGVATGLAWTPHGGDILFIEASHMPGSGKLTLTGQLGDVMKESAHIAMSIVRSQVGLIKADFQFDKTDLHIHVPSGAIPKDGPSAGVTMLSALASLLTNRTVDPRLAMTGEITLRGAVLPVGGIKEKILAAHRAGIEHLLLPRRNEPELFEVPEEVRSQLDIRFVDTVEDVLIEALGLRAQPPIIAAKSQPAA